MLYNMTLNFKRLCYFYRDYPFTQYRLKKKKKQNQKQAQSGIIFAKPHISKTPNLTAISTSPRNGSFNQTILNFLVCTSEVIFVTDPFFVPQRKMRESTLPCPFVPIKVSILNSFLELPLFARWDVSDSQIVE